MLQLMELETKSLAAKFRYTILMLLVMVMLALMLMLSAISLGIGILFLLFSSTLGTEPRQKYDNFALHADPEDVSQAESSSLPKVTHNLQVSVNENPKGIGDACSDRTWASQEETEPRYQKEADGEPEPKRLHPTVLFHVEGRDNGPDALLVVVQVIIDLSRQLFMSSWTENTRAVRLFGRSSQTLLGPCFCDR